MTRQIDDLVGYKRKKQRLLALSKKIGFDPRDYGANPEPVCTACWDGYWCEYEVKSDYLYLDKLYINTKDQVYPPINGVEVSEYDYFTHVTKEKKKTVTKRLLKNMGHRDYVGLNLPVKYTGKMLIGSEDIREEQSLEWQLMVFEYKDIHLLEFIDGALVDEVDFSKAAEYIRRWPGTNEEFKKHGDIFEFADYILKTFNPE